MKHWETKNLLSVALWPVSLLFRLIAAIRRLFFKLGWFKSWRSPVPVIVVGNISVGGTGKTPVVIALVDWLIKEGFKPGVISRGYGGVEQPEPRLLNVDSEPSDVGDEPVLIFKRTAVPVCVFPSRIASAQKLLENHNCDVLIADDGLQHYALQRDLEVIVIDAQKMHGNGFCLPAGPLREPVSRIGQDAFALFNRQFALNDNQSFTLSAANFVSLNSSDEKTAEFFQEQEVLACVGTASPERFFNTLSELGLRVNKRVFPDHHKFVADDFANPQSDAIVMTEKDAVKCTKFGLKNAWYLPVETKLPDALKGRILGVLGKSR